ncbi:hypothetical protein LY76DRAFT_608773 [Colletotrichum caudatum]|nr:hypothetical protein LY76DRAFT_608773 [Colletotrichum caudatum]
MVKKSIRGMTGTRRYGPRRAKDSESRPARSERCEVVEICTGNRQTKMLAEEEEKDDDVGDDDDDDDDEDLSDPLGEDWKEEDKKEEEEEGGGGGAGGGGGSGGDGLRAGILSWQEMSGAMAQPDLVTGWRGEEQVLGGVRREESAYL